MNRTYLGKQFGFTLVELLVALLLVAIVGVMAYRGLDAVQRTQLHLAATADRWQSIVQAVERIGRDIRRSTETPGRGQEGAVTPAFWGRKIAVDGDLTPKLILSLAGSEEAGAKRAGYRLQNEKLELLLWPVPEHREDYGIPAYSLLEGVKTFELAYLDQANIWRDEWGSGGGAFVKPRAVRLRMTLDEGWGVERIWDLP